MGANIVTQPLLRYVKESKWNVLKRSFLLEMVGNSQSRFSHLTLGGKSDNSKEVAGLGVKAAEWWGGK